jgi:hypothetical protein
MTFEPVFLDEPLGERVSMSMLKHYNSCPRSGYLYAKHRRAGVQTVEMVRGSAVHTIKERSTRAWLDSGEPTKLSRETRTEVVKGIVAEVFLEFPVPIEEHDYIRESAYRWADQWQLFDNERVVGLETLFVLEVAGWVVRCKVDFASVRTDDTKHVHIEDYKSGRGAPPFDEISRKRTNGTIAAKNLQLILYMLAVVFGRPVETRIADGPVELQHGERAIKRLVDDPLTVERVGEQVARGCQEASADFVFPGVEDKDGLMLRRPVTLTRLEMLEYLESLETIVKRLAESERTGDWPAIVSDPGCSECPCSAECPIPAELRDHAGTINTPEEAREALQVRYVRQMQDRALGRELRNFVKRQPGSQLAYAGNRVAEFAVRESETVKDKDGFYAALAGGTPLDEARETFVRLSKGTTFVERELTEDEIA